MSSKHTTSNPRCYGNQLYRGGEKYAEQITDEFSTCHRCHNAAFSGRHRILVGCGHTFCDGCIDDITGESLGRDNATVIVGESFKTLKCPLCHMVQHISSKRKVNVASEAMTDRLLRRHNRAHGRADVFHDIRSYQVDAVSGKAAF